MSEALSPNLRLIGRYAILRELRRDRSSVSSIASDPVMHREVVLKAVQMPPPADGKGGAGAEISALEAAFIRQAQAAGKLHHPHIVTVFDAGRVHNVGCAAIERVTGRPLHELLASGWRPEFVHAASIAARIADAIDYAHGQGIAHGHLGPQHVILQSSGAPKVEGFGGWIDGGRGGEEALARTERLLPYFQNDLSEQMRRADVRAIAALLYMMLTGRGAERRQKTRPGRHAAHRHAAGAGEARRRDARSERAGVAPHRRRSARRADRVPVGRAQRARRARNDRHSADRAAARSAGRQ